MAQLFKGLMLWSISTISEESFQSQRAWLPWAGKTNIFKPPLFSNIFFKDFPEDRNWFYCKLIVGKTSSQPIYFSRFVKIPVLWILSSFCQVLEQTDSLTCACWIQSLLYTNISSTLTQTQEREAVKGKKSTWKKKIEAKKRSHHGQKAGKGTHKTSCFQKSIFLPLDTRWQDFSPAGPSSMEQGILFLTLQIQSVKTYPMAPSYNEG